MRRTLLVSLAAALAAVACSGSPAGPTGSAGTLTVMLTDSPFSDAKSLLVTFSDVSVHRAEGNLMKLPFADAATSRTCDLKKLEGAQDVLGIGPLAAGHYTMLRLVVTSAALYFDNAATGPACAAAIAGPPGTKCADRDPVGRGEAQPAVRTDFDHRQHDPA